VAAAVGAIITCMNITQFVGKKIVYVPQKVAEYMPALRYCAIPPLSVVWLRSALITKLDGEC
jgi:hypothetical protein